MHALTLAHQLPAVVAVGRGIFVWLLLRGLVHTIGWAGTLAVVAVIAVAATVTRQRRRT